VLGHTVLSGLDHKSSLYNWRHLWERGTYNLC